MNFLKSLPKDKLQKVVVVGILTLIGVLIIVQFHIRSQLTTLADANKKIADLQAKIDDAENKARSITKNRALFERMRSFSAQQKATMVSGDPFSWIVREISLLSEQRPVKVLALRPGVVAQHTKNSRYKTYSFKIDLSGSYDGIGEYVRDLENKFPTGVVRSLEINNGGPNSDDRASLDVALLVQPEEEKPVAPPAKPEPKKASS